MRQTDEQWMRRALVLARKGQGLTRPNPAVGAVVVRGGRVVGEGFHRKAGGPHAEIVALRKAGTRARGATLYVTLEPCSTWGRTPPCTEAILNAGLKRVVVSVLDPNPQHAGRGLDLLRAKGVRVDQGVCATEGANLLAPFARWITTGRPWITLKLGMSLDGRIADATGRSRWITGPAARKWVHELRRRADAILVGFGTALTDNPSLLPVPSHGRHPYRVVLDRQGRLPLKHRIFTDGLQRQTIVATSARSSLRYRQALAKMGVEVWVLPTTADGLSLKRLVKKLGQRGLLHVVCEGGGRLAGALLRQDLVDEAFIFVASRILGERGVSAIGGTSWSLAMAPTLRSSSCSMVGEDVLINAVRRTT